MVKNMKALFHLHKWKITFEAGVKKVRVCQKCGKIESTCYDMAYGETYWAPGNMWGK